MPHSHSLLPTSKSCAPPSPTSPTPPTPYTHPAPYTPSPPPPPPHTRTSRPLVSPQAFTDSDWQRHLTWRRYLPEPSVSGVVALTLAPVWMWSVLVSLALGLYATYAEVGRGPAYTGPTTAGPGTDSGQPWWCTCLAGAGLVPSTAGPGFCVPRGAAPTWGGRWEQLLLPTARPQAAECSDG